MPLFRKEKYWLIYTWLLLGFRSIYIHFQLLPTTAIVIFLPRSFPQWPPAATANMKLFEYL